MKIIEARALLTADDQASQKIVAMAKQISEVTKAQQAYAKAGGSQFAALAKQIDTTNQKIAQARVYQNQAKQLGDMAAAHQRARESVRGLAAQLMAADMPSKKLQQSYVRATEAADKMGRSLETQKARVRGAASDLEKMGVSVKNLAQAEKDLAQQVTASHRAMAKRMAVNQQWAKRRELAASIGGGAVLAAGYGVKRGVAASLHTYREFDNERRYGKAVMGISDEEQKPLVDQAIHGGATSKYNDIQWLHGQRDLAARGVKLQAILGMMPNAANLGMATGLDLPEAVKMMENAIFTFQKSVGTVEAAATSSKQTADTIVKAMKISGMTPEDVGHAYNFGAPSANMGNLGENNMLAFAGILKKAGIGGDQAGTAFRALNAAIFAPTAGAKTAMRAQGMKYADYQQNPDSLNLAPFVDLVAEKYSVRLDREATAALKKVFEDKTLISDPSKFNPAVMDVLSEHLGGNDAKSKKSISGLASSYRDASMKGVDSNRMFRDILETMRGNIGFANKMFGSKQGSRIATALKNPEIFDEFMSMLRESSGYATNLSKERMAGFDGAVSRLEGATMNLKSRLGAAWDNDGKGGALTALTDMAAKATQGLSELPSATLQVVSAFTAAATALGTIAVGGKVAGALGIPGASAVGAAAGGVLARLPSMALRSTPWAMLGYGYYDLLSKGYEPATANRENAKPGEAHDWGRKRRKSFNQALHDETNAVREKNFPTFAGGGFDLSNLSALQNLKAVVSGPIDVTGKLDPVELKGQARVDVRVSVDGPGRISGMSTSSFGNIEAEGTALMGTPGNPGARRFGAY